MKNIVKVNLVLMTLFLFLFSISFGACSSDGDNDIKIYEYREQIGKKIKELTDLQSSSTFGLREGMYPEDSKKILEDAIDDLKNLLQAINDKSLSEQQIPTETQSRLEKATDNITLFKSTIRTEDYSVPAELQVNGKNGGYIDFGVHPEYSTFGASGQQAFTVDFWIKLKDVEGFFYLISTFTDDENNNHERKGWVVNSYNYGGNNMRMTYGMGFNDLMEPAFGFNSIDEWVHLAIVTNENGVDGETNGGRPIMTKMYLNGELKLSTTSHQSADKPYAANDKNVPMVAFGGMSASGSLIGDKGANGYMKHLHIWKSAKTQDEIKQIMDNPSTVAGTETDLVCGWKFDKMSLDDTDIPDITGKYSAKLVGDYQWIEIK